MFLTNIPISSQGSPIIYKLRNSTMIMTSREHCAGCALPKSRKNASLHKSALLVLHSAQPVQQCMVALSSKNISSG